MGRPSMSEYDRRGMAVIRDLQCVMVTAHILAGSAQLLPAMDGAFR
jgi:hypothetical protein